MSNEMSNLMDRWEQERKARWEEAKRERKVLIAELAAKGITAVSWEYDGCGDSGNIEPATVTIGEVTEQNAPSDYAQRLETLAYQALEATHAGWEINEGSCGNMTWDIAKDVIRIEHGQRVESIEESVDEV